MKRILVPVDGSDYSLKAIEKAKEIAKAFGSEIVLANVVDGLGGYYSAHGYEFSQELMKTALEVQNASKAESAKMLENMKALFAGVTDRIGTVTLEGNPADEIVNYVEDNNFDLVIMGPKGKTALQSIFLGSVTRQVSSKVKISVLIVR